MQNLEMRKTSNCSHWYFYKKNRDFLCFLLHFFVTVLIFLLLLLFFFWGIVLLYSSGWPGIHYVVRLALNLWQSPCLSGVEIIGLSWEYGFRVQHLPIACSRIWVSYPALFFLFPQTNKQTTSLILIDSSHLEYSHTNSGSAKAMKVFYEGDRMMKRIPLAHAPLKVLTALLSYILGTREISLRVAKSHSSRNRKPVLPRAEEDLYNLWELDLRTSPLNFKWFSLEVGRVLLTLLSPVLLSTIFK